MHAHMKYVYASKKYGKHLLFSFLFYAWLVMLAVQHIDLLSN